MIFDWACKEILIKISNPSWTERSKPIFQVHRPQVCNQRITSSSFSSIVNSFINRSWCPSTKGMMVHFYTCIYPDLVCFFEEHCWNQARCKRSKPRRVPSVWPAFSDQETSSTRGYVHFQSGGPRACPIKTHHRADDPDSGCQAQ
jgi:hypothetical protein